MMLRSAMMALAGLICIAGASNTSAEPLVLVEDGEPHASLVVAEDALNYTHQAAELVQDYVRRISGVELPIHHNPDEVKGVRIWIGTHPALEARAAEWADVDLEMTKVDETLRHAVGRDVVILGRGRQANGTEVEVGTYLAAQRFIEQQLGVRWLWPGELGTDVPQRETIAIEAFSKRYAPPMQNRRIRANNYDRNWRSLDYEEIEQLPDLADQVNEMDDAVRTWLNRHNVEGRVRDDRPIRGGRDFWGTHYFSSWHQRYYEDHPEWFALQPDGTRGTFPERDRDVKLCISNPEVLEQYLKEATEFFEQNPRRSTISISPNDRGWQGYCVCEDCRAWDSPDAPYLERPLEWADREQEHRALTDRYVRFWNKAARALRERFPDRDVYVGTWAYHAYRPAPTDTQLEDNVAVGYVGIWRRNRWANSSEALEQQRQLWRDWAERASFLIWRPNLMTNTHGDPYVLLERYGQTMNFLAEHNAAGIDIDSFRNHWATKGPQYYLSAVTAWRPEADARQVMDDYYHRAFGPAAEPIANYYRLFEQLYYYFADNFDGFHRHRDLASLYRELRVPPHEPTNLEAYFDFTAGEMEAGRALEARARRYLDEAQQRVAGAEEVYQQRVAFVATGFEFVVAHLDTIEAMAALRTSPDDTELAGRAQEAYERRRRILLDNFDNYALNFLSIEILKRPDRRQPYLGPPSAIME